LAHLFTDSQRPVSHGVDPNVLLIVRQTHRNTRHHHSHCPERSAKTAECVDILCLTAGLSAAVFVASLVSSPGSAAAGDLPMANGAERFPAAGRARETELLPVTRKIDLVAAFEFRSQRSQIEYSIRSVPLTFSNRDSA